MDLIVVFWCITANELLWIDEILHHFETTGIRSAASHKQQRALASTDCRLVLALTACQAEYL